MSPSVIAIAGFLALSALFALKRARPKDSSDFALGGRNLSGFRLLATLAASNLSAFTIFGVTGAAYRSGWAFFPVMAFGTGFMALSFALIGVPLRRMAAAGGWTTPGDLLAGRFGSRGLGKAFSLLSLAYTLPYLAIQAGSAGRTLAAATGWPVWLGAALVTACIALYVFRGGMKAVAGTDVFQLIVLVGLGLVAFALMARFAADGGFLAAIAGDGAAGARAGADGSIPWTALLGYYVLWGLADPMFPHFIQRFYAARSDRDLYRSMAFYPLVALLVFLPMTAIGVMGRTLQPGLSAPASDGIFTLLSGLVAGSVWGPVFSLAALAALMSTMDSQLLSCASIVTEEFLPRRKADPRTAARAGLVLALIALVVSLRPPQSMLGFLNKTAFPGYASMAPVALAAIYLPGVGAAGAWAALATGTGLVILEGFGLFSPPLPAALFNALVQCLVLGAAWLERNRRGRLMATGHGLPAGPGFLAACLVLLAAATDAWNFGRQARIVAGLPAWMWYQIGLVLALWAAFSLFARSRERRPAE